MTSVWNVPKELLKFKTTDEDGNECWEVSRIIGKKKQNGVVLYKVLWEGFSEEEFTWEPLEHLQNVIGLVEEFEASCRAKKSKNAEKSKQSSIQSSSGGTSVEKNIISEQAGAKKKKKKMTLADDDSVSSNEKKLNSTSLQGKDQNNETSTNKSEQTLPKKSLEAKIPEKSANDVKIVENLSLNSKQMKVIDGLSVSTANQGKASIGSAKKLDNIERSPSLELNLSNFIFKPQETKSRIQHGEQERNKMDIEMPVKGNNSACLSNSIDGEGSCNPVKLLVKELYETKDKLHNSSSLSFDPRRGAASASFFLREKKSEMLIRDNRQQKFDLPDVLAFTEKKNGKLSLEKPSSSEIRANDSQKGSPQKELTLRQREYNTNLLEMLKTIRQGNHESSRRTKPEEKVQIGNNTKNDLIQSVSKTPITTELNPIFLDQTPLEAKTTEMGSTGSVMGKKQRSIEMDVSKDVAGSGSPKPVSNFIVETELKATQSNDNLISEKTKQNSSDGQNDLMIEESAVTQINEDSLPLQSMLIESPPLINEKDPIELPAKSPKKLIEKNGIAETKPLLPSIQAQTPETKTSIQPKPINATSPPPNRLLGSSSLLSSMLQLIPKTHKPSATDLSVRKQQMPIVLDDPIVVINSSIPITKEKPSPPKEPKKRINDDPLKKQIVLDDPVSVLKNSNIITRKKPSPPKQPRGSSKDYTPQMNIDSDLPIPKKTSLNTHPETNIDAANRFPPPPLQKKLSDSKPILSYTIHSTINPDSNASKNHQKLDEITTKEKPSSLSENLELEKKRKIIVIDQPGDSKDDPTKKKDHSKDRSSLERKETHAKDSHKSDSRHRDSSRSESRGKDSHSESKGKDSHSDSRKKGYYPEPRHKEDSSRHKESSHSKHSESSKIDSPRHRESSELKSKSSSHSSGHDKKSDLELSKKTSQPELIKSKSSEKSGSKTNPTKVTSSSEKAGKRDYRKAVLELKGFSQASVTELISSNISDHDLLLALAIKGRVRRDEPSRAELVNVNQAGEKSKSHLFFKVYWLPDENCLQRAPSLVPYHIMLKEHPELLAEVLSERI